MSAADEPELDTGNAGASARREHDRRRANRHQRVHDKHPRTAKLRLSLADDPQHEAAWARGAGGEERVAAVLAKHLTSAVVVLHDRRVPRSRANIDHIAIAPSGVWVIDTKRYQGKVAVSKPLFGTAKLTIAGRDKSTLIDGLAKQVALVEALLAEGAAGVAVRGALCVVDADLPLLGELSFRGYPLLYPRPLARRLNRPGPLAAEQIRRVAAVLATRFPVA